MSIVSTKDLEPRPLECEHCGHLMVTDDGCYCPMCGTNNQTYEGAPWGTQVEPEVELEVSLQGLPLVDLDYYLHRIDSCLTLGQRVDYQPEGEDYWETLDGPQERLDPSGNYRIYRGE